jgi:predicted permease
MKILFMCTIGIIAAKFPRNDPILPHMTLKFLSRLNNSVLLPCLILYSLGVSITPTLLARIGVMMPYCVLVNVVSLFTADTVGYYLHEKDSGLFTAVRVAIANPNAVGLPLLVMQSLCESSTINGDFDGDAEKCYNEATSMIFVYLAAWFVMYWSYYFPLLQTIGQPAESTALPTDIGSTSGTGASADFSADFLTSTATTQIQSFLSSGTVIPVVKQKLLKIFNTSSMIATAAGIIIGLITPIQRTFFLQNKTILGQVGGAIQAVGVPVVALNCLIMAASLAHNDFTEIIEMLQRWKLYGAQIIHRWVYGANFAGTGTSNGEYANVTKLEQELINAPTFSVMHTQGPEEQKQEQKQQQEQDKQMPGFDETDLVGGNYHTGSRPGEKLASDTDTGTDTDAYSGNSCARETRATCDELVGASTSSNSTTVAVTATTSTSSSCTSTGTGSTSISDGSPTKSHPGTSTPYTTARTVTTSTGITKVTSKHVLVEDEQQQTEDQLLDDQRYFLPRPWSIAAIILCRYLSKSYCHTHFCFFS